MANITIVKLKVRRGSDTQRKEITLDQGEVGYTLDTRRLFVGDGATLGGRVIGNISLGPFASITNLGPDNSPGLQVGDIGYADNKLYRLTSFSYDDALSGYSYIGNVPDGTTLEFDSNNKLTVKKGLINSEYFSNTFFGGGFLSANDGSIQVDLNSNYLFLSGSGASNKISPVVGSITQREIAEGALGEGLSGGNNTDIDNPGTILSVKVNRDQFQFDSGGTIELKNVGTATIPISSWAGEGGGNLRGLTNGSDSGLTLNSTGGLEANVKGVDGDSFVALNSEGQVTLNAPSITGTELAWAEITNGLVTTLGSSVYDVVTAIGLSGTNVGDSIPIGAIIPHSNAFTVPPAGYLLCNGGEYLITEYQDLYNVIGQRFGYRAGNSFSVPYLTGGGLPGFLYGADTTPGTAGGASSLWLSGGDSLYAAASGLGVNYIIKYREDPLRNIFNGSPDQVSKGLVGERSNQVYECLNSTGDNVKLSSGGFITFALSGAVRNQSTNPGGMFDKFAIPIFNYE